MTKVRADGTTGIRSVVAALKEREGASEAIAQSAPTEKRNVTDLPQRGRPAKARKDVVQVTAYIEKATHLAVKRSLLDLESECGWKQDFSGLVQLLLDDWLASRKVKAQEERR